ncbi:methyltransferase domain-containing protein [Ponticoccus sp. SC2-23]|uniref:class I SAM-dependent methyltransferase n=1 Tax=Alexandriicola marinus TaxID=2081710 RepID=UPI000FD9253F|nr:methyltransferase domain-containing protein [Alexandriicola marinus]MBM1219328.1 methyltransferase domain-containing protein [Ponticoccus sp. SC6-9]MBM1223600.1 methyltransferase domain-containing protein [Ponticoccus sp. SC6-15]MBM1229141.1 methyltransferase domain-containing protein [Ponticoccus sp. SC6-38]MBM1232566.1 methyltransferase domain-containing protein [Ponticoccus sp. SC6-45]MBM1237484.1 methyltransferase domain-containing protein [Ponticoccus sp. SC6-49]MBM1241577.1 methyltra
MGYDYDRLYGETPDALGPPSREFVDFFGRYDLPGARILDLGCGQGRDALFLARAGHHVVGVDIAPNGIRDLLAVAAKEGLPIEGIVGDIVSFKPEGTFDVILIDRTLHMLDRDPRNRVLEGLLDHVGAGGWMLIADEETNIPDFERAMVQHEASWAVEYRKPGYLFARRS